MAASFPWGVFLTLVKGKALPIFQGPPLATPDQLQVKNAENPGLQAQERDRTQC
jgi:hypothetical protein